MDAGVTLFESVHRKPSLEQWFLETAGVRDNTLILVLSDNGASQEGGPLGFVNAMGPYNFRPEPLSVTPLPRVRPYSAERLSPTTKMVFGAE